MSKEPELKASDKVIMRMTRDGAVEENLTAGTERRVSGRPEDAELVKPVETDAPSEAISAEEQKKVQMLSQQRQFQSEHAEDSNTQPSSETSVTKVLGAAILMPQKEIDLAMWYFATGRTLINYEGRFSYKDRFSLSLLCQQLGVSKAAAVIRLRQLGYIEDRPYLEFFDPVEVWA